MRPRPSRIPQDPNISTEFRDAVDAIDRRIPVSKYDAVAAPTANDDDQAGWQVGSRWIYNLNEYVCVSSATGAANWKQST